MRIVPIYYLSTIWVVKIHRAAIKCDLFAAAKLSVFIYSR